jgi:hypothetical protein
MDVPIEVRDLIAKSVGAENAGRHADAEAGYLEAMRRLGEREEGFRGVLYINLGTNAQQDGRLPAAADFLRKAIALLEGKRGEAHLQCAHAHFNLARQLLMEDSPQTAAHADEALRRYRANPYADAVDVADAAMLRLLCGIFLERSADEAGLQETWREVRSVPAAALNPPLLENFLVNWLSFNKAAHPEEFPSLQADVRSWLGGAPESELLAELLE